MFTGIIQAQGTLTRIEPRGGDHRLSIHSDALPFATIRLGDSIAVNGICLTAVELDTRSFTADVSTETFSRTTLAHWSVGRRVNLELALLPTTRLGGHLVSGHVDGQGMVRAIERRPASWHLEVAWRDPDYGRYVCEKASVAVDGISLTVAGCDPTGASFWIAVIPHTWAVTTLGHRRVGDAVNLEADLLAKYTERLLRHGAPAAAAEPPMTAAWLADHGWG